MLNLISKLLGGIIEALEFILEEIFFRPKDHNERDRLLSGFSYLFQSNPGLSLGVNKSLPLTTCYEGVLVSGKPGTGKSQNIAIPTLLQANGSFVVHDPSGEILKAVGPYLKYVRGYSLKVLNFADPAKSDGYNFISRISDLSEMDTVSELIIRQLDGGSDPFWALEGRNTLNLMQRILFHFQPQYRNPHNLLHLVNAVSVHPKLLEELIMKSGEVELLNQFKSLSQGDGKTLSNVIATCRSVLGLFAIPTVSTITSQDTFGDIQSLLRHKPTAIFITVPTLESRRLSTITNIFLSQLFRDLLKEIPKEGDNSVFLLLDEFGSLYLPDAEVLAANCRKYKVVFTAMVQNTSQLNRQYGLEGAKALKGSLGTRIVFPGSAIDEAREYSDWLGRYSYIHEVTGVDRVRAVKTETEILRMAKNKILVLSGNRFGREVTVKPFYRSKWPKKLRELPMYSHQRIQGYGRTPLIDFSQFEHGKKE